MSSLLVENLYRLRVPKEEETDATLEMSFLYLSVRLSSNTTAKFIDPSPS